MVIAIFGANDAFAQESKFKALFIYKFAEYVEWPSGERNVTVGVVGKSDVFTELSKFAASKGNIEVISISGPSDVDKCEIIFVPLSQDSEVKSYKSAIAGKSILLVSENSNFTGKGSDIGFYLESGKLRFLISEKDILAKKMTPSNKLMALGKAI